MIKLLTFHSQLKERIDEYKKEINKNGACHSDDPQEISHKFFSFDKKDQKDALAICSKCPVRTECLQYSFVQGEEFGIWGGMLEKTREVVWTEMYSKFGYTFRGSRSRVSWTPEAWIYLLQLIDSVE